MNDFTTYVCFALSWMTIPEGAGFVSNLLRWIGGLILVFFNIWVKLDAHRVVKDFAWCKLIGRRRLLRKQSPACFQINAYLKKI